VTESYAPQASATDVAVRQGLHRNQIFGWRQLRHHAALIEGAMSEFVPVRLSSSADSVPAMQTG